MKLQHKLLLLFSTLLFSVAIYQSCKSTEEEQKDVAENKTELDYHHSFDLPYPDSIFVGTETCK
ncbi:hypothetical protein FHS70_004888 [Flammeovirga yaeyamensis]|nr:hypothetical protein [Flammeovirga yaeyamensis]MBB3700708.1 hypothetical protein [Flammeovirga yaeyamensis]